jgi:glycosyltransferase involved in cell wall biosynthesis
MRILVVSCGGIAAERPLRWVVEAGHDVCLVGDTDFYPQNPPANYRFFPSQVLIPKDPAQPPIEDVYQRETQWAIAMAPRLRAIAAEFQPDVVHTNAIGWHSYSCVLAELHPLVVSVWGFLNALLMGNQQVSDRIRYVLDRTDVLAVENLKLVELVKPIVGPQVQIAYLPLGVNLQKFHRQATRSLDQWRQTLLQVPPETFVFFSPRGLAPGYGQTQIMQAYAQAYPRFQRPTKLVFSQLARGGAAEIQADINQQAAAANLQDQVQWLACMPYLWMPTLFNMADAIVNYMAQDAFPSTLVEAAACECSIISSDIPAYRNTVVEQWSTLAPYDDPAALAERMLDVAHRPTQERFATAAQIRQQVMEQFDEDQWKQRFMDTCAQAGQAWKNQPAWQGGNAHNPCGESV